MADAKIGTLSIDKAYIGSDEVQKMYLGETEVYSKATPSSGYNLAINLTPINDPGHTWNLSRNFRIKINGELAYTLDACDAGDCTNLYDADGTLIFSEYAPYPAVNTPYVLNLTGVESYELSTDEANTVWADGVVVPVDPSSITATLSADTALNVTYYYGD